MVRRWVGEVHVPAEAAFVDWVLSDSDKRHWDNNRLVDFHSAVPDALSTEQLAQVRQQLQAAMACCCVGDRRD